MQAKFQKIGLLAGQGDLPLKIIQQCQTLNISIYVIAFEGQTPLETVINVPHDFVKLGAIGKTLDLLKQHNIKDIVFAGSIRRPSLSELSLDWTGTRWLTKIGFNSLGDDGMLKAIITLLENEGFQIHSADSILSDILSPAGNLTKSQPTQEDLEDINRGRELLYQMGDLDIGQALVIQQGLILGIEAIEGTKELIARVKEYKRQGRGPILVKTAKPKQSTKVDLPTIGPDTIRQAFQSGFAGIAIEAGRTQILNMQETLKIADELNIFIYSLPASNS